MNDLVHPKGNRYQVGGGYEQEPAKVSLERTVNLGAIRCYLPCSNQHGW